MLAANSWVSVLIVTTIASHIITQISYRYWKQKRSAPAVDSNEAPVSTDKSEPGGVQDDNAADDSEETVNL